MKFDLLMMKLICSFISQNIYLIRKMKNKKIKNILFEYNRLCLLQTSISTIMSTRTVRKLLRQPPIVIVDTTILCDSSALPFLYSFMH